MKRLLALMTVLVMVFGFGVMASAATINFDDVSSGTNVSAQYAGVTFTKYLPGPPSTTTNDVYANGVDPSAAESSPNVVSIFSNTYAAFDERYGTIHAHFDVAQTSVSIDVYMENGAEGYGSNGIAFMNVFNTGGTGIGTVVNGAMGSWNTLTFTGTDIKDVYFSVDYKGQNTYGYFDNFSYGENGGPPPVPEPGTMMLLGSGLVGLVGFGRRRLKK